MTIKNFKPTLALMAIIGSSSLAHDLSAQNGLTLKKALGPTELETFLTVEHDYIKIPITKMVSGHLHVHGILNGVEGEFILDTGASATVVEKDRKNKFNLKTEGTKHTGAGAGGVQTVEKSIGNSMKLGDLTKDSPDIYLMNLDHVNNALASMGIKEIDGVIGADILTDNKAIIDYANLVLYLLK